MINNITFSVLVTLMVLCQPSEANNNIVRFPELSPLSDTAIKTEPAKVLSLEGNISNNKVLLQWAVNENENTALFEVEKSTDGKNFKLAALVFSSEKIATDNYQFYEKATKKKTIYRIKIIYKNQATEYSSVIVIKPEA